MAPARRILTWLMDGRSADPVGRAIEPLIRVAMVVGVVTSVLVVGAAWFTAVDSAAYLRYALTTVPLQLAGLLGSLFVLQRRGPVSAARLFAAFVAVTLAAASLQLGAVVVSGSVARLIVPTVVVAVALSWSEATGWVLLYLAAAWLSALQPDFVSSPTAVRQDALGRLVVGTVVLSSAAAILAVFRRALHRAIEAAANRADDLARAQRMDSLGRLAAGTAHDFNGTLSVLFLSVEELRDAHSERERAASFDVIEKVLAQARDLTQRLLRLGRGDLTVDHKPIDLHEVVDEAIDVVRPTFGARIELDLARHGRPLRVRGSRTELRQVVVNLLMNAGDAIAGHGRIWIALGEGESAWVRVRDSGAGLPDAVRTRLFEPFVTTKQEGQGTGLGLSTAQAIAHRHHGRIVLEEVGAPGASFILQLPVAAEERRTRAAAPLDASRRAGDRRVQGSMERTP